MLLSDCKKYFNTEDLYEILRIEKTATVAQIKKAYYKQSMKWHPDKADSSEDATKDATAKFQIITRIYSILSDKERRALYDESGVVDDENVLSDEESINVWRQVFKKVTVEDIKKFAAQYQGSEEEENDIVVAYNSWKGDMTMIMNSIMCSTFEDEPRIKAIIDKKISEGVLKETGKYKSSTNKINTNKRRKKAEKEVVEAEQALKEIKAKEGDGNLQQLILKRQAERASGADSFLDNLAAKYGAKTKRSKK
uniref:J domain-containing protein n=1 Tax=Haemonchus contortus TaxID=6289 RepID=A0A7I4Y2J4_HAECO